MIASVDESVGRVLATLEELKLSENTIVIFSSDNGGVGGYTREGIKKNKEDITDNLPLRSGKGCLYEGGVRVPWIVRWPGQIPVGVTDVPIISVDLLPTLAELAGAKLPSQPVDGISQVECFRSGGQKATPRDLFWHFPGYLGAGPGQWRTTPAGAVRSGDWKLVEFFETGQKELYNLKNDLSQKNNLTATMPEKAAELHAKLVDWRKTINAPMPTPNKK